MEELIKNVGSVLNDYEEKIIRQGENFNLYRILGVERYENNTHSKILADLLSPSGSHGQGRKFLELFLENIGGYTVLSNDFVKVSREYYCGKINEESSEGGRIDILIENGNHKIMIENKIDAGEQKKQLERYHRKFPTGRLLFLTLTGYQSEFHDELQERGIHYECVSYNENIIGWLKKCVCAVEDKIYLKNAITQYLKLIENINNKGMTENKNMDIQNLIKVDLRAALEIKNNFNAAVQLSLQEFTQEIEKQLGVRCDKERSNGWNKYFTKENWENAGVGIGFEHENYKLFAGICTFEGINPSLINILQEDNGNISWPQWKYIIETDDESYYIENFVASQDKREELLKYLMEKSENLDNCLIS